MTLNIKYKKLKQNVLALFSASWGTVLESVSYINVAKPKGGAPVSVGSLSSNDGDGYENITQKVKLLCFKLYRAYSMSFNSSRVGSFFCS